MSFDAFFVVIVVVVIVVRVQCFESDLKQFLSTKFFILKMNPDAWGDTRHWSFGGPGQINQIYKFKSLNLQVTNLQELAKEGLTHTCQTVES